MPTNPRPRSRTVATLTAAGVAVLAAGGMLAALLPSVSPGPLLEDRPLPTGGTVAFDWSPPRPSGPARVVPIDAAAADRVVAELVSDATFAPFSRPQAPLDAVYGGPFADACPGLLTGAAPRSGSVRRARVGGYSVTVTGWSYPAGTAAAAVSTLRNRVGACTPTRDPNPYLSSATPPAAGFTAAATNAGDGIAWMVWSRGDIAVSVTTTAAASAAPVTAAAAAAAHLDRVLQGALRDNACLDVSTTVGDAGRNPYTGGPYTGLRSPVTITAPVPDPVPTPDSPPAGFTAPTHRVPAPAPMPDLAPYQVPADWPADQELPALTDLPRDPAPVLVDPAAIGGFPTTPAAPVEPTRPALPPSRTEVTVPAADVDGPGCGWAFTGTRPAVTDAAELATARAAAIEAGHVSVTSQVARAVAAQQVWADRYASWLADAATWQAYTRFRSDVDTATAALDAARATYAVSVSAYQDLADRWQAQQPDPDGDPSPTPDPADPTAPADPTDPDDPDGDPSSAPSPSPSPSVEPQP